MNYIDLDAIDKKPSNGTFSATPYTWTDPASIKPRQWLYDRFLIRGFVSVSIAPGGVGKSTLAIAEAVALTAGKSLLGKHTGPAKRVWLWNLEDPRDELERRIQAVCQHFNISADDLSDRLFVDTGREHELCLAISGRSGPELQDIVIDNVVEQMIENEIDCLIVDPFISSHAVSENDNVAIDMVVKAWGRIADRTNAAIHLIHHSRKQSADSETNADFARGAKALVDAARDVRVLNRMTQEQAEKAGVENHRLYFRVYSDKANLSPPVDKSDWYRLENVSLSNGDYVGVVVPWAWPDPLDGVTVDDLFAVQKLIHGKQFRKDVRSENWIGNAIADVIGADLSDENEQAKVKFMLKTWLESGVLVAKQVVTDSRNKAWIVEVGEWAA